jgi:hypothetical protein
VFRFVAIRPHWAFRGGTQSDGDPRLAGLTGQPETLGRIVVFMTQPRRQPAVYRAIPLQQRTAPRATADTERDVLASANKTIADLATDAQCPPWCADRRNHRDPEDPHELECGSEPVGATSDFVG